MFQMLDCVIIFGLTEKQEKETANGLISALQT